MNVKDKQMYHFHRNSVYNHIWIPGNSIDVTQQYISNLWFNCEEYQPIFEQFDYSFYSIVDYYLQQIDFCNSLLEYQNAIDNLKLAKRELALEQCRKQYYPDRPSRKHAVWVITEKQIKFWNQTLNLDKSLFTVSASGELFKSSQQFLPNENLSYQDSVEASHRYWDPSFQTVAEEVTAEYLFHGQLKIQKKLY